MFIRGSFNFLPLEGVSAKQIESILVAYAMHSGKKPALGCSNRLFRPGGGGGFRPPLRFSEIIKARPTKL